MQGTSRISTLAFALMETAERRSATRDSAGPSLRAQRLNRIDARGAAANELDVPHAKVAKAAGSGSLATLA